MKYCIFLLILVAFHGSAAAESVTTTAALVAAVREGTNGSTIDVGTGIFELSAPLQLKAGMTLRGAGRGKTILTHTADWKPSTEKLPDSEVNMSRINTSAYLVRLEDKASNITVSDMTLRGPQMHGTIFGAGNTGWHLHDLNIEDTLYCGVRTFSSRQAKINDCEFIDAGGKWKRGGISGNGWWNLGQCDFCHMDVRQRNFKQSDSPRQRWQATRSLWH